MHIFYPLIEVSIRLIPLLGFILNASSKVNIHFVLLFIFKMQVCCCFTARSHEVLLNYVAIPK